MRSNPTRFLLSFFFFFSFNFYLLTSVRFTVCLFSLDSFSQNMVFYLQISPVLNLNACFHLFLCCSFINFEFFFVLKKYIYSVTLRVHGYKPFEHNDYYKETIK